MAIMRPPQPCSETVLPAKTQCLGMHARGVLHKRIMRWGDEYCIRLNQDELSRLELRNGEEVDITLTSCDTGVDWEALPLLPLRKKTTTRRQPHRWSRLDAHKEPTLSHSPRSK
jgi:hypothetical protein